MAHESEAPHTVIFGSSLAMPEIADGSIQLVVTSPPYWQLKDYGHDGQVGFGDSWDRYIRRLNTVWAECWRVLKPGGRLVVNVGDQFARAKEYGHFEVLPIRTEVTAASMRLGFQHLPAIIWRKATTVNTSGGAVVMGSYPFPPNGIPKVDYEFILTFKKPGRGPKPTPEQKESARLSHEEWGRFFLGHWSFLGERGLKHLAPFPVELPRRLIRMYSFPGDRVLDPFLGSGTTIRAAMETGRRGVGYEINPDFEPDIRARLGLDGGPAPLFDTSPAVLFTHQSAPQLEPSPSADGAVLPIRLERKSAGFFGSVVRETDREESRWGTRRRVLAIRPPLEVVLEDHDPVALRGISVEGWEEPALEAARQHLASLCGRRRVYVTDVVTPEPGVAEAYLFLANKTFVNARLVRDGFAQAGPGEHRNRKRFTRYEAEARAERRGAWAEKDGA